MPFFDFKNYLLSRPYHFKFLKAVFHKFYLVHFWMLCPIWAKVVLTFSLFHLSYKKVIKTSNVSFENPYVKLCYVMLCQWVRTLSSQRVHYSIEIDSYVLNIYLYVLKTRHHYLNQFQRPGQMCKGNFSGLGQIYCKVPNAECYFESFATTCQSFCQLLKQLQYSVYRNWLVADEAVACGSMWECILQLHGLHVSISDDMHEV